MQTTPAYGIEDTSFKAAGGAQGILALVKEFYRQMDVLEEVKVIRDMHPKDLEESIDKLARFLNGWLGGPGAYQEKYGRISIPQAHSHLEIGTSERDAWLLCMRKALDLQNYPDDFKTYLMKQLFVPAERVRNKD